MKWADGAMGGLACIVLYAQFKGSLNNNNKKKKQIGTIKSAQILDFVRAVYILFHIKP